MPTTATKSFFDTDRYDSIRPDFFYKELNSMFKRTYDYKSIVKPFDLRKKEFVLNYKHLTGVCNSVHYMMEFASSFGSRHFDEQVKARKAVYHLRSL